MFISRRSVSVIGRTMKVERISSGVSRKYRGHGTPGQEQRVLEVASSRAS